MMKLVEKKRLPVSKTEPTDPADRLLDVACTIGNLTTDVINAALTGQVHPLAALKPSESPIIVNANPAASSRMVLAGVIIPMALIDVLRFTAAEIVKDKQSTPPEKQGKIDDTDPGPH